MTEPRFIQLSFNTLQTAILQEYAAERPAVDAEDATDIRIKSAILAGNVGLLQHNQQVLLRQAFVRTADMPYLILLGEQHGIDWDDGTRATGWIKFSRETNAGQDYPISAGTIVISEEDDDGNVIRAELLYAVTLKSGQKFCWGFCEIVEIQAEDAESYSIVGSDGVSIVVATQSAGTGSSGNVQDSALDTFEAAPPTGIEEAENLSAGYSKSTPHTSLKTFTLVESTNDELRVNIDADGAQIIKLAPAAGASGDTVATDIQTKIRALGGVFANAYCRYNVTGADYQFIIFSGADGSGSTVAITAGDDDAREDLGFADPTEVEGGYGFEGGLDPQTQEALRGEVLDAIQNPGYGNEAFYRRIAREVSGVLDAKITGVIGGVYVYPISAAGTSFTDAQLTAITEHLEAVCPVHLVGSIVVINPEIYTLHIAVQLTLDTGYTVNQVSATVKSAIQSYVMTVDVGETGAAIPPTVRINKIIETVLEVTGLIDVAVITLDIVDPPTGTVNLVVPDDKVAHIDVDDIDLT